METSYHSSNQITPPKVLKMPPKITPKNLSYDTTLPPFLQKLQNNYDRGVEGRDGRHESQLLRARAKRPRDADEEAEDEPLYVDEEGNVIDKAKLVKEEGGEGEKNEEGVGPEEEGSKPDGGKEADGDESKKHGTKSDPDARENVVSIGNARKKRKAKVIGSDADATTTKPTPTAFKVGRIRKLPSKAPQLKKLSFGDDEEAAER